MSSSPRSFWQTQFAEDPAIIGKTVRIAGEPYTVIGVAPRVLEAWDARVKYVLPLSWPPAAENPQGRYGVGIQLFASPQARCGRGPGGCRGQDNRAALRRGFPAADQGLR